MGLTLIYHFHVSSDVAPAGTSPQTAFICEIFVSCLESRETATVRIVVKIKSKFSMPKSVSLVCHCQSGENPSKVGRKVFYLEWITKNILTFFVKQPFP